MTVQEVCHLSVFNTHIRAFVDSQINGGNAVSLKPKSQDYTVQSFIYSQYRPFHPERLYALVYDMLILQLEHPSDEECDDEKIAEDTDSLLEEDSEMVDAMPCTPSSPIPSNETVMVNKRNRPFLSPLFRSKGEFFLATRQHRAGEWSQAGSMLSLTGSRPWFCTLSPEEYITGDKSVDRLVQHDIKKGGEWGDRHQELVFIGENINHEGLRGLLDDCLLTDEEYETCQEIMRDTARDDESKYETLGNALEDVFPKWQGDDDGEHDHDHAHDHSGHDHGHSHSNSSKSANANLKYSLKQQRLVEFQTFG